MVASHAHSKYVHNLLKRKVSHYPTFGVYQDDTDGSFKIGRSGFKYNKHVFVDRKRYKATHDLIKLGHSSGQEAYKQIILQTGAQS